MDKSWSQLQMFRSKRIVMIEKSTSNGLITLHIENRFGESIDNSDNKKRIEIDYFKDWLMSLNHEKSKKLKESIEMYQEKINKMPDLVNSQLKFANQIEISRGYNEIQDNK